MGSWIELNRLALRRHLEAIIYGNRGGINVRPAIFRRPLLAGIGRSARAASDPKRAQAIRVNAQSALVSHLA